jgi:hypothetical protein
MADLISKYTEKNLITYETDKLTLTEDGKKMLLQGLVRLETKGHVKKQENSEFQIQKLEINSPYLPNLKIISREIFEREEVE